MKQFAIKLRHLCQLCAGTSWYKVWDTGWAPVKEVLLKAPISTSNHCPFESDTGEDIQWLQNCMGPWHLVVEKWYKTAKNRLKEIETSEMTIDTYINKYPVLNATWA
ncbi:hypothetical protein ACJJTC_008782 [Scirpophaga incertulas]